MTSSSMYTKKVSEVLAFARIGLELLDRAGDAGIQAYGSDNVAAMQSEMHKQIDHVSGKEDPEKASKTTANLRDIMEQYIRDGWDKPTEILEWSGFLFGAARIHWALVAQLADSDDMKQYAASKDTQFQSWLDLACKRIQQVV